MKRITKKIVSMLTAAAICSTFSFTAAFAASDYQSISLGRLQSVYSKGNTQYLDLIAYDANGNEVSFDDYENCTYESSNEDVVAIDAEGQMTMKDYGVSSVTIKYGELSATMMITVTPKAYVSYNCENGGAERGVQSEDYARRGSYSGKITVADDDIVTARNDGGGSVEGKNALNSPTLTWGPNNQRSNLVSEGWFYDNGTTENAEAGIGFKKYENYSNTGVIGIINSTDKTYKVSNVHGRWDQIWLPYDINNATDTGIARTPGWHQVTIVQTNSAGTVTNGSNATSTSAVVYLDGKPVKNVGGSATKWIIYGYAGTEAGKTAYFDDISQNEYMYLDNVTLSVDETDGESLVANFEYLGASGPSVSASYQWYYSDNRNSNSWTAIEGATSKTYKIDEATAGKFVRAGVTVSETIDDVEYTSAEKYSDAKYSFDGTYESVSLGKSDSVCKKGETIKLKLTGFDKEGLERIINDLSDVTFTSADEQIATVASDGTVTAVDYGRTTITAQKSGLQATMMITVTPKVYVSYDYEQGGAEKAVARRGSYSGKITVADDDIVTAKNDWGGSVEGQSALNSPTLAWGPNNQRSNLVSEGWFYDNGTIENAEAGIGFKKYENYSNTGVIGIINSTDKTYKVSNVHGRWDQIWLPYDINNATDTGIARTPGWHQVTIVQTNSAGTVTNGSNATSTSAVVYLDGKPVKNVGESLTKWIIYGYAGTEAGKTAYFDDISQNEYVEIKNVTVTRDENGALNAGYEYYGPKSNDTVQYQWYKKASAEGEWTAISGATEQSYTPDASMNGSHFKAVVTVTDTIDDAAVTTDRESNEYLYANTAVSYADGNVTVVAGEDISGILIIAKYQQTGEYKKLVSAEIIKDIVISEGGKKVVNTGVLTEADGISIEIMLWDGLETQRPLCGKYEF